MSMQTIKRRMKYDPANGVFTACISSGRRKAGDQLGYVKVDGYRLISVDGKWQYAHRLAWFVTHGKWPVDEIDHINGDRDDNRIANLRQCTRSQNMMNTKKLGVCHVKKTGRWQASIRHSGKREYLGSFETKQDACAAYVVAAKKYHGEFARIEADRSKPTQKAMDL